MRQPGGVDFDYSILAANAISFSPADTDRPFSGGTFQLHTHAVPDLDLQVSRPGMAESSLLGYTLKPSERELYQTY